MVPISILATREEIALVITYVHPSIPTRTQDFQAYDDRTLDYDSTFGEGATALEATLDLLEKL